VELVFRTDDKAHIGIRRDLDGDRSILAGVKKYIKIYPLLTENRITNFQTRLLSDAEFDVVYKTLIDKNLDIKSNKTRARVGLDNVGRYIELSLT
jgi:hypothetical protein